MFNFPASPQPGDSYKSGVGYYVYDGAVWRKVAIEPEKFVELTGDTMSGALVLPASPPAAVYEATHKDYVDTAIAAASLYQGVWQVAANIPDLDPAVALPFHSYSWIAVCVDPTVGEIAPAGIPGIGGATVAEGDNIVWNGNTSLYELVRTPGSVTGFLPLSGGVISGDLEVQGATKLVGGTMTGALTVQASPTNGGVALRLPVGGEPGHIAWLNGDGTRKAYLGAGPATGLDLVLDGAASLNVRSGNIYMQDAGGIHWGNNSAGTSITDFSKGICLYGYGSSSQFGLCITSGTLNISVQNAGNKIDLNVGTATQLRVQQGTSHMYSNFQCAGSITSGVAQGIVALQMSDGAIIDFSSGCRIRKVYGSNQFQHHTNAGQVFAFHIQNFGDAWVIDTVGATGNSFSATAPEALALGKELGVARRKPETETTLEGVDVVKMMAALLAKVNRLEAEVAELKGRPTLTIERTLPPTPPAPAPAPTRAPPRAPPPRRR